MSHHDALLAEESHGDPKLTLSKMVLCMSCDCWQLSVVLPLVVADLAFHLGVELLMTDLCYSLDAYQPI